VVDFGGVVGFVVYEAQVGFEEAGLRGLSKEGADVDYGDKEEDERAEEEPGFLLR
jgi:hypothetical protein